MDRRAPRSPDDKPSRFVTDLGVVVPLLICTLALFSMPLSVASAAPPVVQSSSFAGNLPEDIPGSLTVPAPAGIANGDLLIFHAVAASDGLPITPPTGTTLINQSFAGDVLSAGVWYKIALNEPANYTFTTEPPQRMIAGVLRITGHKASGFIGANGVMFFSTGGLDTAIVTAPSIVESDTNFLVLRFAGVREEDPVDLTTPSGHIEVYNVQFAHNKLASARTTQASSGSVPSADFTTTPLFLHYVAHTVSIRGSDAARVGLLGGNEPPEDIPPGGGTARIPLGRVFFVDVPVESTFTLDEDAMIAPAIPAAALFPSNVVIEFDRASASSMKLFQAVHVGTVTLNIVPTNPSVSPLALQIEVTRPDRLGNAPNQFDALFVEAAHRTGVPPQILKGVSRRESGPNLNPLAYRYEPLQDLQVISGGKNLRVTELPYPLYRLATTADTRNAALGEGANIKKPDDISPRSIYCISRDGVLRNIFNDDQFVSALEIFQRNDSLFGLLCPGFRDQRWSDPENASPNVIAQIRNTPSLLEFTAQTPLAASYGIMQMTYIRAIRPLQWKGTKTSGPCFRFPEKCNPSFLFDTDENIAAGGGTLALASDNLLIGFMTRNPGISTTDPNFGDKSLLDAAFRNMLRSYNPGKTTYAAEVLGFSQEFLPVREAGIFQ